MVPFGSISTPAATPGDDPRWWADRTGEWEASGHTVYG